jgi:hypothetical protein
MSSGYATDINELSRFPHLLVSLDTVIPNTQIKLLSNCYGYKGENHRVVK